MLDIVADIGGTNARFGLWDSMADGQDISGCLKEVHTFLTCDFASLAEAISAYLGHRDIQKYTEIKRLSLAVAGPVETDWVLMSNNDWSFSKTALKAHLQLDSLTVINDFTAQALLPPALGKAGKYLLQKGEAKTGTPFAILGPGTGLGMSALMPFQQPDDSQIAWRAMATEGGHTLFSPRDSQELALMQFIAGKIGGPVCFEDILSGRGLEHIYQFYAPEAEPLSAADITSYADNNQHAEQAIILFLNCLSSFVLNAILMVGARQGVYLSGGIITRLLPWFEQSAFTARLSEYDVLSDYISSVPIWVITQKYPGLIGAGLALSNPFIQHHRLLDK